MSRLALCVGILATATTALPLSHVPEHIALVMSGSEAGSGSGAVAEVAGSGAVESKEGEPKVVLDDLNSVNPLYHDEEPDAKALAALPSKAPVQLPWGTKLVLPALPQGSRVNLGGITPQERAYDNKIAAELMEENENTEDDDLLAERNDIMKEAGEDCIDCDTSIAKMEKEDALEEGTVETQEAELRE